MSFPQTRKTLVFRIASEGNEQDWRQFLTDYWLPVCRFAQQRAGLGIQDAEDVAAETFEAILHNQLLYRWAADRSSKLRTLLCTVVRQILGNRARVQKGRQRVLAENAAKLLACGELVTIKYAEQSAELTDAFYDSWVEGLLLGAVENLMQEYHKTGKGDYFRVLYSRVCEQMTTPQISRALSIKQTDAENYYKACRNRLTSLLEELVEAHTRRYSLPEDAGEEFALEWDKLGCYLKDHGGLEKAIDKIYNSAAAVQTAQRQSRAVTAALRQLTQSLPRVPDRETL